jgi:hypothetical protein
MTIVRILPLIKIEAIMVHRHCDVPELCGAPTLSSSNFWNSHGAAFSHHLVLLRELEVQYAFRAA